MTANEFAEKINTPYPTVAKWLRDGQVPGAVMQSVGKMAFWMVPVDVLKDFVRPKIGRPKKARPGNDPAGLRGKAVKSRKASTAKKSKKP